MRNNRVNYGKRITAPVEGIVGENKVEENKQRLFDLKNQYSGAPVAKVHYDDPKYFAPRSEERIAEANYYLDHPELTLPPELRGQVVIPPAAVDVLRAQELAEKKLKAKAKRAKAKKKQHTKAKVKPNVRKQRRKTS